MGILAPTDLRQWPSESEYMPLLRSLADRAARVAINMALLTELFVAPATPVRLMTDAYKEQGRAKRRRRFQLGQCLAAAKAPSPLRSAGALHKMPASRLVVPARYARAHRGALLACRQSDKVRPQAIMNEEIRTLVDSLRRWTWSPSSRPWPSGLQRDFKGNPLLLSQAGCPLPDQS
jgi:hypothetical protein